MADLSKFGDLIEDFAKDSKKENDGVWMTYKRFQYLVARSHRDNTSFSKLMEERMRPFQWAIDRNNMQALKGVAEDIVQGVYAETILKGIRRIDGTVLAYEPSVGVALFKQLPDLWDAVFKFSGSDDNYSPDMITADSKN
jgi:hypothetical protein